MSIWSGKRNVLDHLSLLSLSPGHRLQGGHKTYQKRQCRQHFSTCATMSKSSVKHCRFLLQKLPKLFDFWKNTLAKTLLFLSQIDMCPFCHFWSKKPIKNVELQTTFQHVIILWFCDPPFGSRTLLFLSQIDFAKSGNSHFSQSRFETGKQRVWASLFGIKSHQTAPCRKVV